MKPNYGRVRIPENLLELYPLIQTRFNDYKFPDHFQECFRLGFLNGIKVVENLEYVNSLSTALKIALDRNTRLNQLIEDQIEIAKIWEKKYMDLRKTGVKHE